MKFPRALVCASALLLVVDVVFVFAVALAADVRGAAAAYALAVGVLLARSCCYVRLVRESERDRSLGIVAGEASASSELRLGGTAFVYALVVVVLELPRVTLLAGALLVALAAHAVYDRVYDDRPHMRAFARAAEARERAMLVIELEDTRRRQKNGDPMSIAVPSYAPERAAI